MKKGFNHQQPNQGQTNIWLTPKYIIDALGPFDLDPCAAPEPRPWETAASYFTEKEDGLTQKWEGIVWMNPPYGSNTRHWLKKLAEHGNGFALIFARTETLWFQESSFLAKGALFIDNRIKFCREDGVEAPGNAGAPSVILAFGDEAYKRLSESSLRGILVEMKGLLNGKRKK